MTGWPPRHPPALDVCCYRYKVEWDGCVQRSASNDHGHGGWLCPSFEPLTWLPCHLLGSGEAKPRTKPRFTDQELALGRTRALDHRQWGDFRVEGAGLDLF